MPGISVKNFHDRSNLSMSLPAFDQPAENRVEHPELRVTEFRAGTDSHSGYSAFGEMACSNAVQANLDARTNQLPGHSHRAVLA